MTTRETSFFRDIPAFDLLRDCVIPEQIAAHRHDRRLRLWSAACGTGQEAYSLAILLRESFPELEDWDVRIIGSDLSQAACDYASRGGYSRFEVNRGLPARFLLRYFEREGEEWRVCDALRQRISFECMDLAAPPIQDLPSHGTEFDIVLLRNLLLYLDEERRGDVVRQAHARMVPKGMLLLGHSEEIDRPSGLFQARFEKGCCFYQTIPDR